LKILHISKFYPPEPGGIETFVCDLAEAQVRQGHAVCVLAHQSEFNRSTCWEQINGVKVGRIRTFGQAAYAPVTPEFPLQFILLCRRYKPDVIHAHLPNVSAFWLLFISKPCPLMLHWHADVVASPLDRKMSVLYNLYRPWEFLLLKKADRIIATSHSYLNASKPLSAFREKIWVMLLGINPDRLRKNPYERMIGLSDASFTVLSVGRFAYYKGFKYLVQAAERVPEACFILVGDGPCYSAIKKMVVDKGLEDRIYLPGRVDEKTLGALLSRCSVFCLPSIERAEAFGMVLLEAMCFGKPLITSKISGSGIIEVNAHKVTGLQVPPADPFALADAIKKLRHNPEMRVKMGEHARKRFETRFHIEAIRNQIGEHYKVLNKK